jgi:four helix bundle protein
MKDFRTLEVWKRSHELSLLVYRETKGFPKEELFGLTSQIRRATTSISANIAEGCGRGSDKDFSRFLQIAFGSVSELDSHLLLARDPLFLKEEKYELLYDRTVEVRRMLSALIRRVNSDG